MTITDLLNILRTKGSSDADLEQVKAAYQFAALRHEGQIRHSGEPYITHPLAVAIILASWGQDLTTVKAALLHDLVEDTETSLDELVQQFSQEVAFLVNGVTKINTRVKYRGNKDQVDTLKKLILSLSHDIRVVFVKLADKLHNMQTLEAIPLAKQKRFAEETVEIYAPLAYRIGMANLSGELEDLAFPYLHPKEYLWLSQTMKEHFEQGETYIQKVKTLLSSELDSRHVKVTKIDARAKRLNSLYKKLKRVNMDFKQINDLYALRVIVKTVADCYAVLGIIHECWPPMPGLIKDYIALPKPNGYRSLHTTVFCLDNKPTEFQIRTEEMHEENENGLAAYWAYNQFKQTTGYVDKSKVSFAKRTELDVLNQIKKWQDSFSDSPETSLEHMKIDLFKDRVFCLTPKGDVLDLPENATPVDFAYQIHSDIGNACVGAKVNGKLVALDYRLSDGDVIEIMTQKSKRPNSDWLDFVVTQKARQEVRNSIKQAGVKDPENQNILKITVKERLGIANELTGLFAKQKIIITAIHTAQVRGTQYQTIQLTFSEQTKTALDKLIMKIKEIKGVEEITVLR